MSDDYDPDFLRSVGGLPLYLGSDTLWNFGWMPPEQRRDEVLAAEAAYESALPKFTIDGPDIADQKKVCLFETWSHPLVIEANGFAYPGVHQLTGSCVGAGGGNAFFSLAAWEACRLNEAEQALVPFWLLPYGRSRFYSGSRSRGEGSTGSAFAKAAAEDGVVPANSPGLPKFENSDGLVWGRQAELTWSDGDDQPQEWRDKAKKHLVKSVARCKSADDVREALRNGYPCTCASMYAFRAKVESDPPVLLGRRSGQWAHQMSYQGWWEHPRLGELFFLMNQWGLGAHGSDPAGGPAGGVWVQKADVDWVCRDEVFAFSQFSGFPSQRIPWTF